MSAYANIFQEKEMTKDELKENLNDLEFQVFRMQDNLKEIAKRWEVIGIEQTSEDKWVIVYTAKDENTCRVMLNDCEAAFKGNWDFCLQAEYTNDDKIHVGDIKGPANKGYGSICINYLKEIAKDQNIPYITGDIAPRDWDHVDRLKHFYRKHEFKVSLDHESKSGEIVWYE